MSKPSLLFISPTLPQQSGHGSAIRAGAVLEALSANFAISLIVIQLSRVHLFSGDMRFARNFCERVSFITPHAVGGSTVELVRRVWRNASFDVAHVFRLPTVPYCEDLLLCRDIASLCGLDLDDYESDTRRKLQALCANNGDWTGAAAQHSATTGLLAMERRYLRYFDCVFVANDADRMPISSAYGCSMVVTLPNTFRIPPGVCSNMPSSTLTLLYVGTMDYAPNEDAVLYFASSILPLIRHRSKRAVSFMVVGARPGPHVLRLREIEGVTVTGDVGDLGAFYALADVVVVPLRVGGGTRLKILEAFAHKRPVISTSVGAEGLEVVSGKHLFLADSPQTFADCCISIVEHVALSTKLVESAVELVRQRYGVGNLAEYLRKAYGGETEANDYHP